MNELVSILMPVFNSEKWVKEAIQSVLNQSYSNWELIIVDDGSTDGSLQVVQPFCDEDKRVKVYSQVNKGACSARNKAFELSKGKYIQYLDADDLLDENKIAEQLLSLKKVKDSNAIAGCSWQKFQKSIGDFGFKDQLIDKNYELPIDWLIDSSLEGEHGAVMAWLTPRNLIEKAGYWNEDLKINQDGEFFCRVLLHASQIIFLEDVKVYYRMNNPSSVSQKKHSFEKAKSLLDSYILYEIHLAIHLEDDRVKKAILKHYFTFLSQYDRYYPSLSYKAWSRINGIGENVFTEIIKQYGNRISKKLGFKNYLRLARLKSRFL